MPYPPSLQQPSRPRWITPYDASRCYVLYDDVDCNIPRWGSPFGYGSMDWARGLLVELHRRLGGTPLSLHYRELLTRSPNDPPEAPEHLPVGIEVTARLRDRDGHELTVVSRRETAPHGPQGDYWQVTVNGKIPVDKHDPAFTGVDTSAPTLPYLAFLVQTHLRRVAERPLAPVIPIRAENNCDQRRSALP